MSLNKIILLLGSNLGDKKNNLNIARNLLEKEVGAITKLTEELETEPEDFQSANAFLNQILYMETDLSPMRLLETIKKTEKEMGRTYLPTDQKHQDRLIDIDILFFNQILFKSRNLLIPHPQTRSRNFVKILLK